MIAMMVALVMTMVMVKLLRVLMVMVATVMLKLTMTLTGGAAVSPETVRYFLSLDMKVRFD